MYINLSYPITENDPLFPTNPKTQFLPKTRINKGDPSNTTEIRLFSHNGTHVDTPFHFNPTGKTLDLFSIQDWIFSFPKVVNCSNRKQFAIDRDDIEPHIISNKNYDILLLYSGMSRYRQTDPELYTNKFPYITVEAARFIIEETNIKAIAIDFLSVESLEDANKGNFPIHQMLCGYSSKRSILIYEDVNIEPILDKEVKKVYGVPLVLKGVDGFPVTIFAEINA